MNKKYLVGYLELSFAQFCIGANINLLKVLIPHFPIYYLLMFRFFIGFVLTGIYLTCTQFNKTQTECKTITGRDGSVLFFQALCGGFLFNILTVYGLQYTTATVTGIINSAVPALVAIFSFFILKEKLTTHKSFAIVLCVLGIGILSLGKLEGFGEGNNELLGISLIIVSIIPEALFTILAKLLKNPLSPIVTTVVIQLINALLFLPLVIMSHELTFIQQVPALVWFQMLLYGTSGTLFFVFWYRGLTHISANTAALFMGIMPISTSVIAYMFLGEVLNLYDMLGMLCVLGSLFFGTRQRSTKLLAVEFKN